MKCADCRFTKDESLPDHMPRDCRRHSPVTHVAPWKPAYEAVSIFPRVLGDDWCGDFEPREKA